MRVCHPGGSRPHDFFQLERPSELRYPVPFGLEKGVCRLCATNCAFRRGVSSIERRNIALFGELFLRLSVSDRSYRDPGREDCSECCDDAEFERRCDPLLAPLGVI